jgi:hypothetical protein
MLVGAVVVPETLRLPTIIVQHGDVARMICTDRWHHKVVARP